VYHHQSLTTLLPTTLLRTDVGPGSVRWETYAYLRGRSSIMINSNYYGMDALMVPNTTNREARAATVAWMILEYKHKQDNLELEPAVVRGLWPLCMEQHRRMFNTARIPGREGDTIRHYEAVEQHTHIVVLCKGFYYHLDCYDSKIPSRRSLLPAYELERRLNLILQDAEHSKHSTDANGHIASLTAEDRTRWAEIREECM
jgi:carnitine O-palmitoyltransferase 1